MPVAVLRSPASCCPAPAQRHPHCYSLAATPEQSAAVVMKMRASASCGTVRQPAAAWSRQHRCATSQRHLQAAAEKKGKEGQKGSGKKEQVYIGQGRYVEDDPDKYPSKDWTGSGGWAGGETGLQKYLEEYKNYDGGDSYKSGEAPAGPATKLLGGKDSVYVGQGNYVRDNAEKYPAKDGIFGAGGFAGGEKGVEKYVSDGEDSLEFDETNTKQFSPLTAGLVMATSAFIVTAVWLKLAG